MLVLTCFRSCHVLFFRQIKNITCLLANYVQFIFLVLLCCSPNEAIQYSNNTFTSNIYKLITSLKLTWCRPFNLTVRSAFICSKRCCTIIQCFADHVYNITPYHGSTTTITPISKGWEKFLFLHFFRFWSLPALEQQQM